MLFRSKGHEDFYESKTEEENLLSDILYSLVGIEGTLVRASAASGRFVVDQSVDISSRGIAEKILPSSDDFVSANQFSIAGTASYDRGVVCHALCAAFQELVREWMVFVAQLEHQKKLGRLSLQKCLFYVQEPSRTMSAWHPGFRWPLFDGFSSMGPSSDSAIPLMS